MQWLLRLTQGNFRHTPLEFLIHMPVELILIMLLQLLATETKMDNITILSETHGAHYGEIMDISRLLQRKVDQESVESNKIIHFSQLQSLSNENQINKF